MQFIFLMILFHFNAIYLIFVTLFQVFQYVFNLFILFHPNVHILIFVISFQMLFLHQHIDYLFILLHSNANPIIPFKLFQILVAVCITLKHIICNLLDFYRYFNKFLFNFDKNFQFIKSLVCILNYFLLFHTINMERINV